MPGVDEPASQGGASPAFVLQELFAPWPAVAVADAVLPALPPAGPVEEAEHIAHAVVRRQVEFAMVRRCARQAAAQLGLPSFVLTNGADRAPIWPSGLVGSLTHTGPAPGGYCAAVVARSTDMRAVGVDAESAEPLPLRLWRFVLTSDEQMVVRREAPPAQGLWAKVIFSAKEAAYKAQYPLTGRRLGFQDLEIALDHQRDAFEVRCPSSIPGGRVACAGWVGRFVVGGDLVRTGIGVCR